MKDNNEMTDWYKQTKSRKYHNPSFKNHRLTIPFRMLIVGGSGSGKTTLFCEIIKRMKKTFNYVVVCCKSKDEPLYELLEEKLPKDMFMMVEGVDNIPPLEFLADKGQSLVAFDDLCLERDQSLISEYYIRGRKVGDGVSICYLSQSFYQCPKIIRLQCNYIALKKLSSERDLRLILSECSLGIKKEKLIELYKKATAEQRNFLLIDLSAPPDQRFRQNFLKLLND
jgi:hypothetical protein